MPLIGLADMIYGTESHSPHLKAGFSKHKLVIQARWELPGEGGGEQKFLLGKRDRAALLPLPQPIWPPFVLG
jgi:hypothetical protein